MKNIYLCLLFFFCHYRLFAQPRETGHIITCISIVDKQGNTVSLGSDSVETELFPGIYITKDEYERDFAETVHTDEKSKKFYFDAYAGRSAVNHAPFRNNYFIISGYTREILVRRWDNETEEAMRIIFLNNKVRTDTSAITTYILENIVFTPGTYEIDCSKLSTVKKETYAGILPLNLYHVKNVLKQRVNVKINSRLISLYSSMDFEFREEGKFIQHEGYCGPPDGTIFGNGFFKVSRTGITLYYQNPAGKKPANAVTMNKGNTGFTEQGNKLSVVVTDESGEPVPSASISIKGTRQGIMTDPNGNAVLTINNAAPGSYLVLNISAIGFNPLEIRVNNPAGQQIRCILNSFHGDRYIDSGFVKKGVFTDVTPGYIGIYWLEPGEEFDFNNQEQMSRREFYYNRKIKQRPMFRICPD